MIFKVWAGSIFCGRLFVLKTHHGFDMIGGYYVKGKVIHKILSYKHLRLERLG